MTHAFTDPSAAIFAAEATIATAEECAVGSAEGEWQAEVDEDVEKGKNDEDVEPLVYEVERGLNATQVVRQVVVGAANCEHQVQQHIDVITLISAITTGCILSISSEHVNCRDLEDVHQLVDQRAREPQALMLTRTNLLVKHLSIHLVISAAGAGAIRFGEGDEHEEIYYEASDYYLDQR